MRKKKLIEQNTALFERLKAANKKIAELTESLNEAEEKINGFTEEKELSENSGNVTQTPLEKLEKRVAHNITLNNETEYAAKAIGRIVLSASKHCTELGTDPKNRELINLILGKSEVAKSEILSVLSGEDTRDSKKIQIDNIEAGAKDYFVSIMVQEL